MDLSDILKQNGVDPKTVAKFRSSSANQEVYIDAQGKKHFGKEAIKLKQKEFKDRQEQSASPELSPATVVRDTEYWLDKFVTEELVDLKRQVRNVAPLSDPVIITAPTGSGKELIAKALHGGKQGNFVAVNCGGFPEHLFESEMFGHVKGSFTGAINDKDGLLQQAHNGTIFIDEISLLPKFMQGKLLRTLQEKTIRRVGANHEESINCRVVAATNRSVDHMMETGEFMEDLYWRISTIELSIPSLKSRHNDWEPIAKSLGCDVRWLAELRAYCNSELHELDGGVRELQRWVRRKQLGL